MPLPTIEVPKYKLKIPSTGKMVTYRPFLVKEEKVLLTALETSNDESTLVDALINLVDSCIETKNIKVSKLTSFDLEYLFIQLRAKSVGEIAELNVQCSTPDCGIDFPHSVNLNELKIHRNKEHTEKIELSNEIGVIMKYPTLEEANAITKSSKTGTDELFSIIACCIDSIFTPQEVFSHKDHSQKELEDFVEQLSPEFFKKIMSFFETMPTMENSITCTCPKCKQDNTLIIKGIEDFFD